MRILIFHLKCNLDIKKFDYLNRRNRLIRVKMGNQQSNLDEFIDWVTIKAFKDTEFDTKFRHLTLGEKQQIDLTICRALETNRRIETKLLQAGKDDPDILNPLKW